MIEIDNLIDKILDVESSSASVYNSSATVTTTAEKKPSTTDCYRQPQQYESTANCSQRQTDIRQSQAHSAERSDGDSDSTAKLYGQDDASLLQINNNVATSASVAVATTSTAKQTKGVRNALMSEMVDFSSLNSMISTQQDNATGQYFLFLFIFIVFCSFQHQHLLLHNYKFVHIPTIKCQLQIRHWHLAINHISSAFTGRGVL